MADTPTETAPAKQQEEPGQVPDVELVRLAQKGDGSAFAELVARHQRQLYRLALRMTGSEADAQEVLQEAFLNAYQSLDSFKGHFEFFTWLYRIAVNTAISLKRKQRVTLSINELGSAIVQAVAGLPDDYRTVFLLKDVDGLSNEDIAAALDLTVPAVKSRLHRARLSLREKLGEFFGE